MQVETTKVTKGKRTVLVNADEVEKYRADGWKLASEPDPDDEGDKGAGGKAGGGEAGGKGKAK